MYVLNKFFSSIMGCFAILAMSGCSAHGNGNNFNNDELIVKYNRYNTYDELVQHLKIMNEIMPENDTFLFDVNIDGFETEFIVAGIDYRSLNPNFGKEDCNSDYLETREIFYELTNTDGLVFTVVFNKYIKFEKDDIFWTRDKLSFNGTVLNYERNANGDSYYLRYKEENLLTLKTNILDYDVSKLEIVQEYLRSKI